MKNETHWQKLRKAALTVPASSASERASWVARNMCELALYLHVTESNLEILDDTVRAEDLSDADPQICRRLTELRATGSNCPDWYPIGSRPAGDEPHANREYVEAGFALCRFADALLNHAPTTKPHPASPIDGKGQAAIDGRAHWRPTFAGCGTVTYVQMGQISPRLIKRGWMHIPGQGPTMLVNDQSLDEGRLDVWWGIHNGGHLDHLAWLGEDSPQRAEFGVGLLCTEGLAVALEILAAAELLAGVNIADANTLANGFSERVGRLPLPNSGRDCWNYRAARNQHATDFFCMPTVASAYVVKPLQLIASRFSDPCIPSLMASSIAVRFDKVARLDSATDALVQAAKAICGRSAS